LPSTGTNLAAAENKNKNQIISLNVAALLTIIQLQFHPCTVQMIKKFSKNN